MASEQDRLGVRVTVRDRERINALCAREELSASALIRQLLRLRAIELGLESQTVQHRR